MMIFEDHNFKTLVTCINYHVKPTYREQFNYTQAGWLTDLGLIASLYRLTDLSNFFKY
jgi:hypothetical protein